MRIKAPIAIGSTQYFTKKIFTTILVMRLKKIFLSVKNNYLNEHGKNNTKCGIQSRETNAK